MENTFKIPFGKFKDFDIEEVPSGYVKWMMENIEDEIIQKIAEEEWYDREDNKSHFWEM
jgi:hypothetical protein